MLNFLGATPAKVTPAPPGPWYRRKYGPATIPVYGVGVALLGVLGIAIRRVVMGRMP